MSKATKPLGLPHKRPRCFDSQAQWNAYREVAEFSAGDGFTFCSDCTPDHKQLMVQLGRCAHPLVKFVRVNGVLVGRRP